MKPHRASKHLRSLEGCLSWKAIADNLKTRSVDDIRNYWQLKLQPLFDAQTARRESEWTEQEDLKLLKAIESQEVLDEEDEPLDFASIGN